MKNKQQTLAYPQLKSVFNYQRSKQINRGDETDPITVTVATVSHVVLNK